MPGPRTCVETFGWRRGLRSCAPPGLGKRSPESVGYSARYPGRGEEACCAVTTRPPVAAPHAILGGARKKRGPYKMTRHVARLHLAPGAGSVPQRPRPRLYRPVAGADVLSRPLDRDDVF